MNKYTTPEYRKYNAEKNKLRYAKNEEVKKYEAQRRKSPEQRFAKARLKAKQTGREFSLTLEDFKRLLFSPCYYCNSSLIQETGLGIALIDLEGAYVIDNVHSSCSSCNKRRAGLESEEFKRQTVLNGYYKES